MRIGIYNPYFDGFGGGERYTLTLASHWSKKHDVFLFWDNDAIRGESERRFNLDLSRVKITHNFFHSRNVLKKLLLSKQYDLIFFLSDGSIPTSFARYNILHFQVPFPKIHMHHIKLRQYQAIVCNSYFTKNHVDTRLSSKSLVIYPPVDTSKFSFSPQKEKIILSVGRFTNYFQTKKQEVLIEALKKMKEKKIITGWKLVLAGGLLPSDQGYFASLKDISSNLPIEFHPNISFEDLVVFYKKASIYWHAAGFGQDDPQLMEHFGITTVEAMASGCLPIVYRGGGLPEIIEDGVSGFLWKTEHELVSTTERVIRDHALMAKIRKNLALQAKKFDVTKFYEAFDTLLYRIAGI